MDKLSIDTPEQIQVNFSVAGVGSRFLAFLFDTLIQSIVFFVLYVVGVVFLMVGSQALQGMKWWMLAIFLLTGFSVYVGYFALFEILWNGQTPGKRHFKIRVIQEDGRPVPPAGAITRNLLRIVDQLPFGYVVGIVCMLMNDKSKRVGDFVAGTVVVHEQPLESSPMLDLPPEQPASTLQLVRLTAEEAQILETFLGRADDLDPHLRTNTARELAMRIGARLNLPIPSGQDPEAFLRNIFSSSGPTASE